jgi:alpha-glucosidase
LSAPDPRPRRHGLLDRSSLATKPLDGGGVRSVQALAARVEGHACRITTWRPELEDGARPPSPSLVLAREPSYEPLEAAPRGEPAARFESDGQTVRAQVTFTPGTSVYGAGEVAGGLLRNGRAVKLWNTDAWRYGEERPALYQSHPYVVAVRPDGSAVGLLADSVRRGMIAVALDGVEFQLEAEPFDLHVISGAGPLEVGEALAALIGRIALPPLWALGYHQCRWSYMSADEVLRVAWELRKRRIPCDAIWLDIDSMDRLRPFTWNAQRFPDPKGLIEELHAMSLRAVTILDPGLAVDPGYEPCASGLAGDHFVHDARGRPARGRVWPGICHFPDFTREATRSWWAGMVRRYVEAGMDGLWIDMNEPSVFRTPTKTLAEDCVHRGLGGGTHGRFHNLYGQLMAEATHEGLRTARPEERPFILTRSNHLSGSRFAATWTGDNQASWDDLRWSIPMTLSLSICGQPFAGPDIGGFDGDPTPELFARWFELAAYLPFARGHGEKTSCRKEPWSFGPETEACVRAALERRMRLLPYLYTLFRDAEQRGHPIVRPLFYADPRDAELREVDDAFLLGPDLLVAPVVEPGARTRRVLLPRAAGGWYAFHGGQARIDERAVEAEAPLGTTPVFARAGAILPLAPPLQHTAELATAPLELHVFLGDAGRARGKLYEDSGAGLDYQRGVFRLTRFEARLEDGEVVLDEEHEGSFEPPARPRSVVVHGGTLSASPRR